jgi:hypothetical protein
MSSETVREAAHRLIGRDRAIRAGGKMPSWGSVHDILEFVRREDLLSDPVVAPWLGTLAGRADLWFSHRMLEFVGKLLDDQQFDQAHALYRLLLGLDDDVRWQAMAPVLVSDSIIVEAAIEPILGRKQLLVSHPRSWGRTACEMLGRVVREHQRAEWPSQQSIRAAFAETGKEPFDANQAFQPEEDDFPTLWYFAPDRLRAPRVVLAGVVEEGVRGATELLESGTFELFAEWLLGQTFAVGTGILLAALLDGLTGDLTAQPWHAAEATRLLVLDQVQRAGSLRDFRRLLRLSLPRPAEEMALALTDVIRRCDHSDSARLSELEIGLSWGGLNLDEQKRLADASARGELPAPSDPRLRPLVHSVWASRRPAPGPGFPWPHPEDAWAIDEFATMYGDQESHHAQAVDHEKLERRLQALQALLKREERNSEGWLGEILGWCERCISDLRREALLRLSWIPENGSLSASEWEGVLSARAPWWQCRAEAALVALATVPNYHRELRTGGLAWGTSDPVLQSLVYLDEILAVDGNGVFAKLRMQMELAVDGAWPHWPDFTRATALIALRAWYWHQLPRLRSRLSELASQESDPVVLRHSLERLIRGGPDVGADLERLLRRAPQLESSAEIANRMAYELGCDFLYAQGLAKPDDRVRQLSDLLLRVLEAPPEHVPTRQGLIQGLLFGALDLFKNQGLRTRARVDAWITLVVWACDFWPWCQETSQKAGRFPVVPIMAVLAQSWPESVRRQMLAALQGCFLCIIEKGTLDDFCSLHHQIRELLGEDGEKASSQGTALEHSDFSDGHLLELCRASVQRVVSWRQSGHTTRDLAWSAATTGRETADLVRAVVSAGSDRTYLCRELPAVVDLLAEFGAAGIGTELRLLLRRG